MKRFRWVGAILIALLLASMGASTVRAEEVVIAEYPDSYYEPGPGWPAGWTPPPVPTEITPAMRRWAEDILKTVPHLTRIEMRVLDPMPKWTAEYPYRWAEEPVPCGDTIYIYKYPRPDQGLILTTTGISWSPSQRSSDVCLFEPVNSITKERRPTEEQRASTERFFLYEEQLTRARGGLGRATGSGHVGTPNRVLVFLNGGFASSKFDVPAYLDTTLSRVRVPIRFVSELMGGSVEWEAAASRVTIRFAATEQTILAVIPNEGYTLETIFWEEGYGPDSDRYLLQERRVTIAAKTIVLTIDQPTALVNGAAIPLDAPPVIRDGRTMIPIRFVAEQMGSKVYWVGSTPIFRENDGSLSGTYQVHIFTPVHPLFDYPSWYLENRAQKF